MVSQSHSLRLAVGLVALAAATRLSGQTPTQPQPVPGEGQFATVRGLVIDSLHNLPLVHALVRVNGLPREAMTDTIGEYHLDSLPPGNYKLIVMHPLLDTIGISLVSETIPLVAGKREIIDLAIPGSERLVQLL